MIDALSDLKVLDLCESISGSYCAMLLGDFGADVIKLESPNSGSAGQGGGSPGGGARDPAFMAVSRNRRSLTVDLTSAAGRDVASRMLGWADVVVESFAPGRAATLGVDYATARRINPRLVYCSITPFGHTGPYAHFPGNELTAQAIGGIMSATGMPGLAPAKAGVPVVEMSTGIFAAYGILAACEGVRQTGEGQHVDMAFLDTSVALSVLEAATFLAGGPLPQPLGSTNRRRSPHGAFRAKDGFVVLSADGDRYWRRFCKIIGREVLIADPRFVTNDERVIHRDALQAIAEEEMLKHDRSHWLSQLQAAGIPSGPVNTYQDIVEDAQTRNRQMILDLGDGSPKMLGINVKLSGTPGKIRRAPPERGQHTQDILLQCGYSYDDVEHLREVGAI